MNIYHMPHTVLAAEATPEKERNLRSQELTVWYGCAFSDTVLQSNVDISIHLPPPHDNCPFFFFLLLERETESLQGEEEAEGERERILRILRPWDQDLS